MKSYRLLITICVISIHVIYCNTVIGREYYLSPETDIPLISAGVFSLAAGNYFGDKQKALSVEEINSSDRDNVNIFDRSATYNRSKTSDRWSDYTRDLLIFSPVVLTGFDEPRSDIFIIAIMYLESIVLETGLTDIVKSTASRKRPYVYNDDIQQNNKTDKQAVRSFYSGHTSSAFNSAVFFSTVFSDYYPQSSLRIAVWVTSLTIAAATGYLRYAAGMHYPSDIITGAAAGAVTGYMVPALHRSKTSGVSVLPFINPGFSGILIGYAF